MSNLFYTKNLEADSFALEGDEFVHLTQVLRRNSGDRVAFTDGRGTRALGELVKMDRRSAQIQILSRQQSAQRKPYHIHLAVAPTKNMDRFEWFLEKSTEIGIDAITPIWCKHSERLTLRPERLEKVMLSAMKQSQQSFLPMLHPAISFDAFMAQPSTWPEARFIGYVEAVQQVPSLYSSYPEGQNALMLIGPEGDFSSVEVQQALAAGFRMVHLGHNRLRTETAALAAVHTFALKNESALWNP